MSLGLCVATGVLLGMSGPAYGMVGIPRPSSGTAASLVVAQRLNFRVDNIRTSPSRVPGAARGNPCFTDAANAPRPLALLPKPSPDTPPHDVTLATTVEAHPTFFVFIPEMGVEKGEFTVWSDDQSTMLAVKQIQLPQQAGVIPVSVPDDVTLEVGETYYWTLEVLCNEDDRSRNTVVEGLVQRVNPDAALTTQLEVVDPRDRPSLYADAGLWYETLASLAQLRSENPADPMIQAEWEALLDSVNLEGIADAPLLMTTPSAP